MVWQSSLQCTELMPPMDDFSNSLLEGGKRLTGVGPKHCMTLSDVLTQAWELDTVWSKFELTKI